ncbi:hypothetical protein ACFLTE_07700 [Bacteroidota bacterium]
MSDKISKIINIILYSILGASVLAVIFYYAGGVTAESLGTTYEEKNFTELYLIWAYILLFITAILAIGFPIIQGVSNPKNLNKTLVPLAATVVVVLAAYFLSSDEKMDILGFGLVDDPLTLKYSGTMIITVYILMGIAFLSIIYSEVKGFFK